MQVQPSFEQFRAEAHRYPRVNVSVEYVADALTPVVVFDAMRRNTRAVLFESVEGGETWARYSIIGCRPIQELIFSNGKLTHVTGEKRTDRVAGDPFFVLRDAIAESRGAEREPRPGFTGGWFGAFSYEAVRYIESAVPMMPNNDLGVPEMYFMEPSTYALFDNIRHALRLIRTVVVEAGLSESALRARYDAAAQDVEDLQRSIFGHSLPMLRYDATTEPVIPRSNVTQPRFMAMVDKAREAITAGEGIQVVVAQRFEADYSGDPLDLYRALRAINPSPYMFYLDVPAGVYVGASPEVLVRLSEGKVVVRPIAGTRPRGKTHEQDIALEKELLADPKEIAEHVMLVDLGRNDVGRVSRPGTVRVPERMVIEKYSHVMHIVSEVDGELEHGLDAIDVLRAAFPAGTVSGAPKVRAMQIIAELEPTWRGPYAGAVGYFDYNGNMDTCIAIRTFLLRDGKAYAQAGAGIVYDSVSESEYAESHNKARALMKALAVARQQKKG